MRRWNRDILSPATTDWDSKMTDNNSAEKNNKDILQADEQLAPIIPADEAAAVSLKQITRKEFMRLTLGAYLGLLPGFLAFAGFLVIIYLIVVFVWGT